MDLAHDFELDWLQVACAALRERCHLMFHGELVVTGCTRDKTNEQQLRWRRLPLRKPRRAQLRQQYPEERQHRPNALSHPLSLLCWQPGRQRFVVVARLP